MKTTKKLPCSCKHDQQDQLYGAGIRLANLMREKDKSYSEFRCTVCSKVHRIGHTGK